MDITLPAGDGGRVGYRLVGQPVAPVVGAHFPRLAYAAAHVVADPFAMTDPWSRPLLKRPV